jgi:20S proteasome alpha/beta subunit
VTTIAFDGKILAADSRSMDWNLDYSDNAKKIFAGRGLLIGFSGNLAECMEFWRDSKGLPIDQILDQKI